MIRGVIPLLILVAFTYALIVVKAAKNRKLAAVSSVQMPSPRAALTFCDHVDTPAVPVIPNEHMGETEVVRWLCSQCHQLVPAKDAVYRNTRAARQPVGGRFYDAAHRELLNYDRATYQIQTHQQVAPIRTFTHPRED